MACTPSALGMLISHGPPGIWAQIWHKCSSPWGSGIQVSPWHSTAEVKRSLLLKDLPKGDVGQELWVLKGLMNFDGHDIVKVV